MTQLCFLCSSCSLVEIYMDFFEHSCDKLGVLGSLCHVVGVKIFINSKKVAIAFSVWHSL